MQPTALSADMRGSVSRKELETLMARGLSEEEAVDIIIRGMLA